MCCFHWILEGTTNGLSGGRFILVDNKAGMASSVATMVPSGGGKGRGNCLLCIPHSTSRKKVTKFGFGKWQLYPWGVMFTIHDKNQAKYRFYGDLHLNPFCKQPKFTPGVVLREKGKLEPVTTITTTSRDSTTTQL